MADLVVFSLVSQKLANLAVDLITLTDADVKIEFLQSVLGKIENYIKDEEKKQKNSEEFRKRIEQVLAIAYDLEDIVDTHVLRSTQRWIPFWTLVEVEHYSDCVPICLFIIYIGIGILAIKIVFRNVFAEIKDDLNLNHELGKIITRMLGSELMRIIHTSVDPVHVINIGSEGQGDFPESSMALSTSKQHKDEVQLLDDIPFHLRACLAYFWMFPKEMDIPVRRLIHLWLAEGFMKEQSESPKSPKDLVVEYVRDLKERGMVDVTKSKSDGSPKRCRLTAGRYDLNLPQVEKTGLFYLHKSISSIDHQAPTPPPFAVRRVVEYANIKDYPQSDLYVKYLRSYISFNFQKKDTQAAQIGEFVRRIVVKSGYSLLNVLDLEGVYKPALPNELGNLCNLRYLGLRWTFLDALPLSVQYLTHLQTLDVKHTYIRTLAIDLGEMKSLRHLYLNDISLRLSNQLDAINIRLQTLSGLFVDKKIGMKNELAYGLELKKLGLTCHSSATPKLGEWIQKLTHL